MGLMQGWATADHMTSQSGRRRFRALESSADDHSVITNATIISDNMESSLKLLS